MNEINVFEFVSDEELWTEIYGKATNRDVWTSLSVAVDLSFVGLGYRRGFE
jgi:hypothetical protein